MIGALLLLLACSSPEPQVTAPVPTPAPPPADEAPTQALGLFWRDLQVLPSGPAGATAPAEVPAALGCIATGQHDLAKKLGGSDTDPERASVVFLTALLTGDAETAADAALTAWEWGPETPLSRAIMGHHALALTQRDSARRRFEGQLNDTKPDAPLRLPVGPPGPCGVSLDPESYARWLARLGMGWAAANDGDHLLALEHQQAILAQQTTDRIAGTSATMALLQLDRVDQAATTVERLEAAWPEDPLVSALNEVVAARRAQDAHAAEAWTRELARGDEPSTCPYEGLGLVYLAQGRTDEAKEQLQRSIELDPDLGFEKYTAMARILMDEGDLAGARAMLDKALANHPGDADATELMSSLERLEAEAGAP